MENTIKLKAELRGNPVLITRYVTPKDGTDCYYESIVFIFVKIEKKLPSFHFFYFTERISIYDKNWIHKISQSVAMKIATSQIGDKLLIQVKSNFAGLPKDKILYFHNYSTGLGNITLSK